MITSTILKPIGNGQYTPPQSWRKLLGIDKQVVRARLDGRRIILEPLECAADTWDISVVNLNKLNTETIKTIEQVDKNYKTGKFEEFISHNDFWDEVEN